MKLGFLFVQVWACLIVFYTLYIAAINIYSDWKVLKLWVKLFSLPIVVVMVLFDVIMQITLFSLLFFDRPRDFMVTQRLARYRSDEWPQGPRKAVATLICTQALNPFDPTQKHC